MSSTSTTRSKPLIISSRAASAPTAFRPWMSAVALEAFAIPATPRAWVSLDNRGSQSGSSRGARVDSSASIAASSAAMTGSVLCTLALARPHYRALKC